MSPSDLLVALAAPTQQFEFEVKVFKQVYDPIASLGGKDQQLIEKVESAYWAPISRADVFRAAEANDTATCSDIRLAVIIPATAIIMDKIGKLISAHLDTVADNELKSTKATINTGLNDIAAALLS